MEKIIDKLKGLTGNNLLNMKAVIYGTSNLQQINAIDKLLAETRQEVIEILKEVKDKLEEYAQHDDVAKGNGYGCFSDPFKFIKPTINKIDEFLKSS